MRSSKHLAQASLAAAVAVWIALATTGCTGSGLRPDTAVSDDDLRELKARVVELQKKAAVSEVEIARLRDEVAALQSARGGARSALAPSSGLSSSSSSFGTSTSSAPAVKPSRIAAAKPSRSSTSQPTVRRTPPPPPPPPPVDSGSGDRSGDVVRERRETSAPIEEVDVPEPDRPGVAPAPAPTPPAAPKRTPVPAPANPPASSTALPSGPVVSGAGESAETLSPAAQALYDRGYTLYHQGHYVDAEASFQRFLQSEPKSELADNSLYWIGECRYSRHDLRGALAAFRETVERYPQGNKVPDALLKAGQTMEALGDKEGARTTYKEVAKRFPNTAAAAAADERRAKLP
jgi:tol-pal system protein YbgF